MDGSEHAANDMVRFISFAAPFQGYAQTLNAAVVMQAALRRLSRDFGEPKMARIMMRSAAEFLGYVLLRRVRELCQVGLTNYRRCLSTNHFQGKVLQKSNSVQSGSMHATSEGSSGQGGTIIRWLLLRPFIKALLEMRAYAIKQSSCLTLQHPSKGTFRDGELHATP